MKKKNIKKIEILQIPRRYLILPNGSVTKSVQIQKRLLESLGDFLPLNILAKAIELQL